MFQRRRKRSASSSFVYSSASSIVVTSTNSLTRNPGFCTLNRSSRISIFVGNLSIGFLVHPFRPFRLGPRHHVIFKAQLSTAAEVELTSLLHAEQTVDTPLQQLHNHEIRGKTEILVSVLFSPKKELTAIIRDRRYPAWDSHVIWHVGYVGTSSYHRARLTDLQAKRPTVP